MPTYGQFCPVAMASEVLTERWTPLVVRELLCGSTRFNDLRRGVPLMSPSLLSKRLKTLERIGVVERAGAEYHLTPAGEELRPLIESMGVWGQRWARGDVQAKHFDASLLMWDIHRNIDPDRVPAERVVIHFHLKGSSDRKSRFWLVLDAGAADLCLTDPGHDVDLHIEGHIRTMADYWMGHTDFADAVRSGDLVVHGPPRLARAMPTWFLRSPFAPVELPA
jgi:DNA-binding HxlR family transcriptional regulator